MIELVEDFNFKQPYVVAAAIIEKDGSILMVKESRGPHKGKWNLPAGRWDSTESLVDCVKREALEETGYEFDPDYIVGFYSSVVKSKNIVVFKVVYSGKSFGQQETLSDDISETKYFKPEEIMEMEPDSLMNINMYKVVGDYLAGRKFPLGVIDFTESV